MKCDHIRTRAQGDTPFFPNMLNNSSVEVCLKEDVDAAIDELKTEHHKERDEYINMVNSREQTIKKLEAKLGAVNELVKESRELLKESQRMHQRCADGASKQIRRLKRALYKACANWALSTLAWLDCIDQGEPRKWSEMQQKCLKKVEEYK